MIKKSHSEDSFISSLAYNDYIALLCFMDAEWTRNRPDIQDTLADYHVYLKTQKLFEEKCSGLKQRVNAKYEEFSNANNNSPKEYIDPYILKSKCYIPFGHADDLNLVLLDDLDAIQCLTSQMEMPTEKMLLAFCPKIESLCGYKKNEIFTELHSVIASSLSIEERHPLLVFTQYKMGGLLTVGYSLLFQQYIYQAMARKIVEVQKWLLDNYNTAAVRGLFKKRDIESIKCVFLDLQGNEEIGTIFYCSNYSVAMSMVAALRSLTVFDLLRMEQENNHGEYLKIVLNQSKAHHAIARIGADTNGNVTQKFDEIDSIYSDNIFRWTNTTLAATPSGLFDDKKKSSNGYLSFSQEYQVVPGHNASVENDVRKNSDSIKNRFFDLSKVHGLQVGTKDYVFTSDDLGRRQKRFSSIDSLFSFIRKNIQTFGTLTSSDPKERKIIDIVTELTIPIPVAIIKELSQVYSPLSSVFIGGCSPLQEALPEIQQRLFNSSKTHMRGEPKDIGSFSARLDIGLLKTIPRKYGLPVSLRRTLEYLYQNYANLFKDPFMFDAVLDLYDSFASLHSLLTHHLNEYFKVGKRKFIDIKRIEQLSMMASALQSSMNYRTVKTYPENPIREMSVDFRGGLNQILHAADVPIKCGLGLLRKYVNNKKDTKTTKDRNTVGGVTYINYTPGATCYALRFGTEDNVRLACFHVDVPHVLHPPSYCENLHETFHLIYDSLCDREGVFNSNDSNMQDRIEEVFAHILSIVLVFNRDVKRFLYFHIWAYSKNLSSIGEDAGETIGIAIEHLIRLFVVVDSINNNGAMGQESRVGEAVEKVFERFEEMVNTYKLMLPEISAIHDDIKWKVVREYYRQQFLYVYPMLSQVFPNVLDVATKVCNDFIKEESFVNNKELFQFIREGINKGRPLIRCLYRGETQSKKNAELTPLIIVAALLRYYISDNDLEEIHNRKYYIPRNNPDKNVDFTNDSLGGFLWNEFLIDPGAAYGFCPVPTARRNRLLKQIVMLKTMWDISSNMRGRRLWEIIKNNWSEEYLVGITNNG